MTKHGTAFTGRKLLPKSPWIFLLGLFLFSTFSTAQATTPLWQTLSIQSLDTPTVLSATEVQEGYFTFDTATQTITSYVAGGGGSDVTDVVIPAEIAGQTVLHIATTAFEGRHLTSVSFAEGSQLQTIGTSAFANNRALIGSLTLPETLTSVGTSAFSSTSLEAIYFPQTRSELTSSTANGAGFGVYEEKYTAGYSTSLANVSGFTTLGVETVLVFSDRNYDPESALLWDNEGNLMGFYPEHSSFDGRSTITIPEGITNISSLAFANESSDYTLVLPSTLETVSAYAFSHCNISQLDFSYTSVTSVGTYSFSRSNIDSIDFSNSPLETVEASAFYYSKASKINLEGSALTTMGNSAFSYASVEQIVFPAPLETLGTSTFLGASTLTVDMGDCDKLLALPDSSFQNATSLRYVILPPYLETIGNSAFRYCSSLSSITSIQEEGSVLKQVELSRNIKTIGTYAFSSTTNLNEALSLYSIESIGTYAFGYYSYPSTYPCGFTEIHILSNKIESIPYLRGATSLTKVTLCESITSLPDYLFYNRQALESVHLMDSNGNIDTSKNQLPSSITTIPNSAFYQCYGLDNFDFTGITAVGSYSFYKCTGFSTVDLADVETVGTYAFQGSTAITSLSAPQLQTAGNYSFSTLSAMTALSVPELVTIGSNAFQSCSSLTSLTLPKTTTLGDYAFGSNSKLVTADLPSVETVGNYAFTTCPLLTTVHFSDHLTSLGNYVFNNNYLLKDVAFSQTDTYNLTDIGTNCFQNCYVIELTIPNSVETIGTNAFSGIKTSTIYIDNKIGVIEGTPWGATVATTSIVYQGSLWLTNPLDNTQYLVALDEANHTLTIENYSNAPLILEIPATLTHEGTIYTVTELGQDAFKSSTFTSITVPSSVITLGENCFYSAKITNLYLNEGLVNIGDYAFYSCTLGSGTTTSNTGVLSLPDSVLSLGEYVFSSATIRTISMGAGVTRIPDNAFYNARYVYNLTLHDNVTYTFSATAFSRGSYTHGITSLSFANKPVLEGAYSLPYSLTHLYLPSQNSGDASPMDYETLSSYGVYGVGTTKIYYEDTIVTNHLNDAGTVTGYFLFHADTLTLHRYVATTTTTTLTVPEYFEDDAGVQYPTKIIQDRMMYGAGTGLVTVNLPSTTEIVDNQAFSRTDSQTYYPNLMTTATHTTSVTTIHVAQTTDNITIDTSEYTTPYITINWEDQVNTGDFVYSLYPNTKNAILFSYHGEASELDLHKFNEYVGNEDNDYVLCEIRTGAFKNNSTLTSLVIPDTVRIIEAEAFYGCSNLEVLTLPTEVDFFGSEALRGLSSVLSLRIPEGVTEILQYDLYYAPSLRELYFPSSLSSINSYALYQLRVATANQPYVKVYFQRDSSSSFSFATSSSYAFNGVLIYTDYIWQNNYLYYTKTNQIGKYVLPEGTVYHDHHVIPSQFTDSNGVIYQPTSLIDSLHASAQFKTVEIPDTITTIGSYCFRYSTLESVTLGENVTSLGINAFQSCASLKTVDLSQMKVASLPNYSFQNCVSLTDMTLPTVCTSIGTYALGGLSSLTVLDLSHTAIINGSFLQSSTSYLPYLAELTLPSTMTSITLDNNQYITELDMGHTKIISMSFDNTVIESLILPSTLTSIPSYAFRDMPELVSLYIPDTVTSVGTYAFDNTGLITIRLPDSVKTIYTMAICNNENLLSVYIGSENCQLTTMNASVFSNNPKLWNINIGKGHSSTALSGSPWGADNITRVRYEGDFIVFDYKIVKDISKTGAETGAIHIQASIGNDDQSLSHFILPDNKKISASGQVWPGDSDTGADYYDGYYIYPVTDFSGTYIFEGYDQSSFSDDYGTVLDIHPVSSLFPAITAQDIEISVGEFSVLKEENQITTALLVELAEATALLGTVSYPIAIAEEELAEIQAMSNIGDNYDFILSASNQYYTIHQSISISLVANAPIISGEDLAITLAEAKTFTEALFREKSGVMAEENKTGLVANTYSAIVLTVSAEDLAKVQSANQVGQVVGVTVTASFGSVSSEKTFYVTMIPETPLLDCQNITITQEQLTSMTEEKLRDLIGLTATTYDNISLISQVQSTDYAKISTLSAENPTVSIAYYVTDTRVSGYELEATASALVTLYIPGEPAVILANDFTMTNVVANTVTSSILVDLAQATATITQGDSPISLTVSASAASLTAVKSAQIGDSVPVTFQASFTDSMNVVISSELTVHVLVIPADPSISSLSQVSLRLSQLPDLTEESILSIINAVPNYHGSVISYQVEGLDTVKAMTEYGEESSITVTVWDKTVEGHAVSASTSTSIIVFTPEMGHTFTAEDFDLSRGAYTTATAEDLISHANVQSFVTETDGTFIQEVNLDITVTALSLSALATATPGETVDITFETVFLEDSYSKTVSATIDKGSISISSDSAYYLQQENKGQVTEDLLLAWLNVQVEAEQDGYTLTIDSLERVNALTVAGSRCTVIFTATDQVVTDLSAVSSSTITLYDLPTITGDEVVLTTTEQAELTVSSLKSHSNYSAKAYTVSGAYTVYMALTNSQETGKEEDVLAQVQALTGTESYVMQLVVDDGLHSASTPITVRLRQNNEPSIGIEGTVGENNWYTSPVTVRISSLLTEESGLSYYSLDGSQWTAYTDGTVELILDKSTTIYAKNTVDSQDSAVISQSILVDTLVPGAPTIVQRNPDSTELPLIFDLSLGEIGDSAWKEFQYSTDEGENWFAGNSVQVSENLTIQAKVINHAGVESPITSIEVTGIVTPEPDVPDSPEDEDDSDEDNSDEDDSEEDDSEEDNSDEDDSQDEDNSEEDNSDEDNFDEDNSQEDNSDEDNSQDEDDSDEDNSQDEDDSQDDYSQDEDDSQDDNSQDEDNSQDKTPSDDEDDSDEDSDAGTTEPGLVLGINTVPYLVGTDEIPKISTVIDGVIYYIAKEEGEIAFKNQDISFSDVGDHWAKSYITYVTSREIMVGVGGDRFEPDAKVDRAMVAQVIYSILAQEDWSFEPYFEDVSSDHYYYEAVHWSLEQGILTGKYTGLYAPEDPITREEVVAILFKAYGISAVEATEILPDQADISSWAETAVGTFQHLGLITGYKDGSFAPKQELTRAEFSVIAQKVHEYVLMTNEDTIAVTLPNSQ